ncbi:hypothetical protein Bca52824_059794 [Brassica carinata]|uniref:40S ribosomal protein S17 n=1 Tax=Brassica carinata TaxID=52824 RepID=A0A8X7R2A1_BRACI|nr:hypothetical protein Bca52824_059794 [Brassica carinata]
MGRVRTKTVKKSTRQVIEKYYSRITLDFHTNKKILEEVGVFSYRALIPAGRKLDDEVPKRTELLSPHSRH